MKRHADARGDLFGSGQQLSVAPEIVNAEPLYAQLGHELGERGNVEDLAGHKMMALQARRIAGLTRNIDAPERQLAPLIP